ncbi:MAG TPA: hypothetical protein VM638_08750 [Actinomycetota bacterium]|nr:hypothetical protein [Actinomycetota bacterium]
MALRDVAIRVLPASVVDRIRRRRAVRRYLHGMADELLERHARLESLEEQIATRPGGFYERVVKEVLDRTDVVLQQLDRRVEGLSGRQDDRLAALEREVAELRRLLEDLRAGRAPGG